MARFAARSELFDRVVFLEDYDMALAKRLTAGIDVWINTPRRPWEASGTSGMKSVLGGGLQLSVLDGWWAEGYDGHNGWRLVQPSILRRSSLDQTFCLFYRLLCQTLWSSL